MTTQMFTTTLEVIECSECHVPFGASVGFMRDRRRDHGTFYCPAKHPQYFPAKSDLEKAEERAAAASARARASAARLTATQDQLQATERSLAGHKAAKTRLRNRIAAGACPCCQRNFQNLARHMAGQHPDFAKEA